jgi:MFS transporter, PAT family, beta-lactamase induction signal transducer AmpG
MTPGKSTLRVLLSVRMLLMLLFGFSSGLPLLLTGSTLQAWLMDEKVPLPTIGLFALVGMPYALKFLWSPVLDYVVPPFLGRRRGWILVIQLALVLVLAGLGFLHPARAAWVVAAVAFAVTFVSASQDIVLDAYRRELLVDDELGLGSSLFVNGYRLSMLVAGAFALFLADRMPWRAVYLLMAACMALCTVVTLLAPEPSVDVPPPRTLREAVVEPFIDFFDRRGAWLILAFVVFYKIGDQMASSMTTPFVLELGLSKTELAAIAKVFGMGATLGGALVGGIFMLRLGIHRALWVFGVAQATAILAFAVLAHVGRIYAVVALAVALENFTAGMGTSAFVAYMASLTNKRFTATQYALITSLMGIPRVLAGAPTGYLARELGWTSYFVFCALAAIPGLLLLSRVAPWGKARRPAES